MSAVLLVAHHDRLEAGALARVAAAWLRQRGHDVWMLADDAIPLGVHELQSNRPAAEADLAISLGGDGTMLRTVKLAGEASVPIIGVNVGLLGYLTEVEPEALHQALERWFAGPVEGEWHIDERMLLAVSLHRAGADQGLTWTALNEGVVEKQEAGHTIRLQVWIDGTPFTSYAADGLILATPTGSTAYSLSAGGAVVSPTADVFTLTPICPHTLSNRSVVVGMDSTVRVKIRSSRADSYLTADGQKVIPLSLNEVVTIKRSPHTIRLLHLAGSSFFETLRRKLNWSGSHV